jgi:two-component system, OmpR family, phosphate regulon sensor histidine kinase PhoR
MSVIDTLTLLANGLTLALALGFLLIVLWQDTRKEINQFFAVFLFLVTVWNAGALLVQTVSLIDPQSDLVGFAVGMMELGFTGSSIAVYALTAVVVGAHTRRFRLLAFSGIMLVLGFQLLLIISNSPDLSQAAAEGTLRYRFQPSSVALYFTFDSVTLYLLWQYRRKVRSRGLRFGLMLFVVGQSLAFLNPELRALPLSINMSSFAALIISFAILRLEIITPLAERVSQVEAMHRVSLAITSQLASDTVLNEIASQAVGWLGADAAGIFLSDGQNSELELATVYNLPAQFVHSHLMFGQGVAGTVAQTHRSVHVDNYARDWRGFADLPLARETFGSVICVPLIYGGTAIGVLMVITARQGRLFSREDVHLLELLGSQAAVAIAHGRLFTEQRDLTTQVEAAHGQLETLLVSTENPVVAVDRHFKLIFANTAARKLFELNNIPIDGPITSVLPPFAFPENFRAAMRDLRHKRAHIYEVSLDDKVYLCHLAPLGKPRVEGWVAVLNDVTQLKELDRIKSEMVRMASHDLKNPLQIALANLELLAEDLADVPDLEIQESLTQIEKQLERMNRIIGGVLDLERIKAGTPAAELCYPSRIVTATIDELRQLAGEQEIALEAKVEENAAYFLGDPKQFERALVNLVENAIKFTPRGGKVMITAGNDNSNVVFQVSDTGIGIPQALQPQVFERFFRGRQKGAEHVSGSGLGLSLVKTIVENHRGKVWLESTEGIGTIVFISVPATTEIPSEKSFV